MQRDMYDAVTVSILIPTSTQWAEGKTFYDGQINVRAFTEDDIDPTSEAGKRTYKELPQWQQREFLGFVAIIRALESNDQAAADKAILELKSRAGAIVVGVTKACLGQPDFAKDILIHDLCTRLDEVRFVLWKTGGKIAPGLLCPDVRTAFLVRALMSAVGAKAGLRLCPKCGTTFMQKRADQDYCSVKCREAHRVERWRRRKSSAIAKQEGQASEAVSKRNQSRRRRLGRRTKR